VLLFKPEHVDPILAREKTQTRRRWSRCRVKVGAIHQCNLNFSKGSRPFARIRILSIRQEPLIEISDEDCRREGYADRIAYLEAFIHVNHLENEDIPCFLHEPLWVVDFELVKEGQAGA
jgi:hypothetical protein